MHSLTLTRAEEVLLRLSCDYNRSEGVSFQLFIVMGTFVQKEMNFGSQIMKFIIGCTAFFLPLKAPINAIFILISIDWMTGVYRSLKANRKFTSYRLRKSVEKTVGYVLAVIAVFVLEQEVIGVDWGLVKIVAGYIAITEVASIYENIAAITGKEFLLDLWKIIKKKFDDKLIK